MHTTSAPAYLHSEGKATLQDSYLNEADDFPTDEELATLRRVPARIPWKIFTVRIRIHRARETKTDMISDRFR